MKGQQEFANYKKQEIPEFQGNPIIEALPQIWSREEVEERLSYYPRFSKKMRDLPPHLRKQLAENAREFFIPQGIHFEIETSISIMLRRGLIRRNPSEWSYWTELNERIDELSSNLAKGLFLQTKARGFSIVGIGGMGKSSAVENVLFQYPQVIVHTKYHGVDFIFKHLVWLKLDCPQDGSTRGLCINFFRAVDQILGTNYEKNYVTDRSTVTTLLPRMARVGWAAELYYQEYILPREWQLVMRANVYSFRENSAVKCAVEDAINMLGSKVLQSQARPTASHRVILS
jgi:hypothetical protein